MIIYWISRYIVSIALKVFYQKLEVNSNGKLLANGPIIIAANHPNTFMDPYIIATQFKQRVGFLGNASMFVHPLINKMLVYFNVIPVYRDKDVALGVKPDNQKTFKDCFNYLKKRNTLMLFPEGTSIKEYKLRKIKTGAARIALGVEQQNDFTLGVRIQPIGLYYSNASKFGSKVHINIGDPIVVNNFKDAYLLDEIGGVQQLTQTIRESLHDLTINIVDEENEILFVKLKLIYKRHLQELNKTLEEFELAKELINAIQYFKVTFPDQFNELKLRIEKCSELIKVKKLQFSDQKIRKRNLALSFGFLSLGLPVFLFGIIQNAIPFYVPLWIANSLSKDQEYRAPIMVTLGIFLFPIWYSFSTYIFSIYTSLHWGLYLLYLSTLPLTGFFSIRYVKIFQYLTRMIKTNRVNFDNIKKYRDDLIRDLDEARLTYLNRL